VNEVRDETRKRVSTPPVRVARLLLRLSGSAMPTVDLATLVGHPIFEPASGFDPKASTLSLRDAALSSALVVADVQSSCPRRALCVRESDVIVAVGNQLRMAPIAHDKTTPSKFKVCSTHKVDSSGV